MAKVTTKNNNNNNNVKVRIDFYIPSIVMGFDGSFHAKKVYSEYLSTGSRNTLLDDAVRVMRSDGIVTMQVIGDKDIFFEVDFIGTDFERAIRINEDAPVWTDNTDETISRKIVRQYVELFLEEVAKAYGVKTAKMERAEKEAAKAARKAEKAKKEAKAAESSAKVEKVEKPASKPEKKPAQVENLAEHYKASTKPTVRVRKAKKN